jgi:hypothetical protein
MNKTTERTVYFLELLLAREPWGNRVSKVKLLPIMVKVVCAPLRTSQKALQVTHADVFTISGRMPKKPMDTASKANLIRVIIDALKARTGKDVEVFSEDIIIYGGQPL